MKKPSKIIIEDFNDMFNFEQTHDTLSVPMQGGMMEMDFDKMKSFPNHKFKLYKGQHLDDMAESIRQLGILLPIILWHTEDGIYTILSGHNRRNAAILAGLTKGPVIIKENLTYEEATLIVTETNLHQRSFADMSHSERAYCLAQHYEALKSQGKRNDLITEIEMLLNSHSCKENSTSAQVGQRLTNREKIGDEYGLSHAKVARYIRIAGLVEPLILQIDNNEIAFLAGYTLSFIEDKGKQQKIADLMKSRGYKVDMKKAELLRDYYENGKLTQTAINEILSGAKTRKLKSTKPQPVKVKQTVISKYFTTQQTAKEIEDTIEKALALYFENRNKEVGQIE